ncbi:MAG TPA: T9SS type A sorting domain-containing protein [bacterium]
MTFDGAQLPAGIYFLRLEAASHQRTLKLVLLK